VNAGALDEADVTAIVIEIVPAIVEALAPSPPKAPVNSSLRIGVEVALLLAREPTLSANEVDGKIRGRREVVHEAVRLAKAELLGARGSASEPRRSPAVQSGADPGSHRFPCAGTGLQGAQADRLLVEEGPATGPFEPKSRRPE
jgi:hypothetical protein